MHTEGTSVPRLSLSRPFLTAPFWSPAHHDSALTYGMGRGVAAVPGLSVKGTRWSCRYLSHIAQIPHTKYVVVCSIVPVLVPLLFDQHVRSTDMDL